MSNFERNIDIVLCIDGSSSMKNLIYFFHNNISILHSFIKKKFELRGVFVNQLRIKVICFRNNEFDNQYSLFQTKFFNLPSEQSELNKSILSITPQGDSHNENSGLEALALAIASDWCSNLPRSRQIILLFSDTLPNEIHSLDLDNPLCISQIPSNFDELTDWWEDTDLNKYGSHSKRLVLFAPDEGYWSKIGMTWSNTIHVPNVKHPFELDFSIHPLEFVISTIVNSI